jgi:hypothetical protein
MIWSAGGCVAARAMNSWVAAAGIGWLKRKP